MAFEIADDRIIATNRRTATLTGIQPTGELHLGNYAGAIRPLARLAAGGRGNDRISGATGRDRLSGGPGNDGLRGGGGRDRLTCGSGRRDRATATRRDTVSRTCERRRP